MKYLKLFPVILALFVFIQGCTYLGLKNIPAAEIEEKYTDENSRFIYINGLRTHYRDEGKGEPLLLLHGVMSSLHTWDGWTKLLKSRYRIIRIDIPPFGLTGPAGFEYSIDNYIKFLNDFTEAINLKEYSLAGNSLGGYFAWNLALRYPDKVKKLVLVDPAAYPQKPPFPVKMMALPFIGKIATIITPEFVVAYNIRSAFGDPERVTEKMLERYHELMLREGTREGARQLFRYMIKMNHNEPWEISEIKQPTLIMWGDSDIWIPVQEMTRNWKRDLPLARLIIYKNAGHIPMEEIPDETAADVLIFLSEEYGGK